MYLDRLEADDPCDSSIQGVESFMMLPDTRKLRAFGFHYITSSIHVGSGENWVATAQNSPGPQTFQFQHQSRILKVLHKELGHLRIVMGMLQAVQLRQGPESLETQHGAAHEGWESFQGTGGMIKKLGRLTIKV